MCYNKFVQRSDINDSLFFIKNKFKNQKLVNNDKKILEKYTNIAQKSKDEILNEFNSNIEKGLSSKIIEEKHKMMKKIL